MYIKRCVLLFCLICLCMTQTGLALNEPSDDDPFDCILSMIEPSDGASRKVTLLCDLVEAYAGSGQKDKAMRFLSQAIEEAGFQQKAPAPDNPFADLQAKDNVKSLIAAYGYVGMYEQALALINTLDRKSERGRYLKHIANKAASAGQKEKIVESLAEAVKAVSLPNPEPGDLYFIAVTYAKVGEYEKAVQTARAISNKGLFMKDQAFTEIADEYIKDKQTEKASEMLSEALRAAQAINESGGEVELESKTEAFALIAAAYFKIGQNDKSIPLLSQALELTKKYDADNLALKQIAVAYAKVGEYEQAKRAAASIEFEPSRSDAFAAIAHSYLDAGQKKQALEMLEQALRITASLKRESAVFKIDDLADLAVEFAKADQKERAAEVLLSALQEARREYSYNQPSQLVEIAKAYLKAGIKPDAQAKDLLHKICSREPIPITAQEQEKQRRVEQAADMFIQRWHETLDMNVLFDEMYVSNAKQRKQSVAFFYGVYQFLTASGDGPAVDKDVDEKVLREGFMAFCNMFFLHDEYLLAYMQSTDASPKYSPDILGAGQEYRKLKLNPKRMSRAQVMEFVAKANNVSSFYRKHLLPEAFKTPRYQENSKPEQDDSDNDSKPFSIIKGFPEYFVGDDKEVYRLRRGIFEFYFVEEEGKLKVLLLGLEL